MHRARSEILFLMLQKLITIVFMDWLLVLVCAPGVCFLVLSILLLPACIRIKMAKHVGYFWFRDAIL